MTAVEEPKTTNPSYATVSIADIHVGNRHRKDYGDLPALAESMDMLGLLQPIGLNTARELLWGRRRLKAAEILEWPVIPSVLVDCDPADKTLIEYHENVCRKDFTISEQVEIGRAMEKAVGNRQGQRTDKDSELVGICPQVEPGEKTRDAAAEAAGFSSTDTYRRAKSVIDSDNQALIGLVDREAVSVAMGAQVAKLDREKQGQFVVAVRNGKTPADALASVLDDALHVNDTVQEWIADGSLSGVERDAVENLGGMNNAARQSKQAQYVRRRKSGDAHAAALESVRKGGKRTATAPTSTKPAETDGERRQAKQDAMEAIGTLIVSFAKLGLVGECDEMIKQLSAKIKAA